MAGTTSFELHGTDPASEAYSVLVVYENFMQNLNLTPALSALEHTLDVLYRMGITYFTLDHSNGVFSVQAVNGAIVRYKPSYVIENITPAEETWYNANKNAQGLAYELSDYNGDGVVDLKIWTPDGKQVFYTVY